MWDKTCHVDYCGGNGHVSFAVVVSLGSVSGATLVAVVVEVVVMAVVLVGAVLAARGGGAL